MARPAVQTSSDAPSDLIERGDELSMLGDCVEAVRSSSRGRLVLVGGEAGVGKTALLTRFCEDRADGARVLWGACDALFTPRPLGPFLDIAESTGGELRGLVETGAGAFELAAALMSELRTRSPTILVLEDAHWADDATLDLLRLLGQTHEVAARGVARELSPDRAEPLPPAAAGARRIRIGAVERPAQARAAVSGGGCAPRRAARRRRRRPARADGRQSVLRHRGARGRRGDPRDRPRRRARSRRAAHARGAGAARGRRDRAAASASSRCSSAVAPDALPALDECLASGMLVETNGAVAFRHELARLAVEEAAAPDRTLRLHRATLAALRAAPEGTADLARLAHHAEAAGDTEAVLELAPAAGARASALGAHREAAAQYARALRFAGGLPLEEARGPAAAPYAGVLRDHAGRGRARLEPGGARGPDAAGRAPETAGGARRCRARRSSTWVRRQDAVEAAREAASLFEDLPPGPLLAIASTTCAPACTCSPRTAPRRSGGHAGARARDRARSAPHRRQRARHARRRGGAPGAAERRGGARRSLAMAQRLPDAEDLVGRTHVLLAMAGCRKRSLDLMERYVEPGLAYCDERDLDVWSRILLATRSWVALERGRLGPGRGDGRAGADGGLHAVLCPGSHRARAPPCAPRRSRSVDAARGGARGGRADRQLWWKFQVAAAEAEALWLEGRPEAIADATAETFESGDAARRAVAGRRARLVAPPGRHRVSRSRPTRAARSNCSSAATGAAPSRRGGPLAAPTRRRSPLRSSTTKTRSARRSRSSRSWEPGPPRRSSRAGCGSAARVGCRAGRGRRRRRIRPT